MKVHKMIKSANGRITIQSNSVGIPELKVRVNGKTEKIRVPYGSVSEIEKVVDLLLDFKKGEQTCNSLFGND